MSNLVELQVAALVRDLCSHDYEGALLPCTPDLGVELVVFRQSSDSEALHHKTVEPLGHEGYDILRHPREKPDQTDIGIQAVVEADLRPGDLRDEPDHLPALDARDLGVVGAGEGGETLGVVLPGAGPEDHGSGEYHEHPVAFAVRGAEEGIDHVAAGIGVVLGNRYLGTGYDDALLTVLDQIAQPCGGVGHGVGAVRDHEAVVIGVVLPDGAGDLKPVDGAYVGAVHVEQLDAIRFADAGDLRYLCEQFIDRK